MNIFRKFGSIMVSRDNILSQIIPLDNFGSWYPPRRKSPSIDCIIKMNEQGECPGSYRFAYSAENHIECSFEPAKILNGAELNGYELSLQFTKADVQFFDNSSIGKWCDLLTELEKDRVTIVKAPADIANGIHDEIRPVLIQVFRDFKKVNKGVSLNLNLILMRMT